MVRIEKVDTVRIFLPTRRAHKWRGLTEEIGGYVLVRLTAACQISNLVQLMSATTKEFPIQKHPKKQTPQAILELPETSRLSTPFTTGKGYLCANRIGDPTISEFLHENSLGIVSCAV